MFDLTADSLGCPERIIPWNVLDIVCDGVVTQNLVTPVDLVHSVLEGKLSWGILLVLCKKNV